MEYFFSQNDKIRNILRLERAQSREREKKQDFYEFWPSILYAYAYSPVNLEPIAVITFQCSIDFLIGSN